MLQEARVSFAGPIKALILFVMFLPVLLIYQPAKAASTPVWTMNSGLNDAWFDPEKDGQGFLITVFPDLGLVSLAWFTYDTELPPEDAAAHLGNAGHRWLSAIGPIEDNHAELNINITSGGVFDTPTEVQNTDPPGSDGSMILTFENCASGTVEYDIPSIGRQGTVPIQRVVDDNRLLCETLVASAPNACVRPEPDLSQGVDNPPIIRGAIIPPEDIFDGGPGPDGIPPLLTPDFIQAPGAASLDAQELVVGVKVNDDIRAYPHNILNWHEVVNDVFEVAEGPRQPATLSYCPLTGSASVWKSVFENGNRTFGTSGLLYNSNLVMYDRETESLWSQMLERSISGILVARIPERFQVVETTWGTWQTMFPETKLLSTNTGFSRNYDRYPYGSFRENDNLLFPVDNMDDNRLHRKERVLGINVSTSSKAYPISNFSNNVEVINDTVGDMQVVAAGSSGLNFGVVFNRQLEDCTVLDFEAVQDRLPVVMRDNQGNEWDVFGHAVSGTRMGQRLQKTNSYIAYWYAWTAFFPGADIHQ